MNQFASRPTSDAAVPLTTVADDLIAPTSAAQELGVTTKTLSNWRVAGKGPGHYKIGGKVMYRRVEIRAWLAQQRRTSTSDPGQAA
jgi:predicted DNA-binding transcriptional regulator AlpA